MIKEIITAIRSSVILWILTALIYPFFLIFIGQTVFPYQANGSLIKNNQNQIIGSALIGQTFTSERYFISRPSVINYSEGEDAKPTGLSGASNLAPSNPELIQRVEQTIFNLKQAQIEPTADLVYTSGSGLDPHITLESARLQIPRIAASRNLDVNQLEILIKKHTNKRFLSIFGEPGVNVLTLNLALDEIS
ncbi:potassium-transporting ATPase C chain [Crocosphaera subtropica ATCC 51142]|uniref:Potassium-transporting ATPase KdpC subunit n=1 Tax=Crocosphaera subtropica (strain ATCC 51142 / BH68) TaxID=43989 RepID=B1WP56_CROS5|nr:K(+)-transporting ATPase subunit C [Crocosphaera subtropica]ACB53235.1 potassium-transporting ATPase C chain [Crocosphaera subtropica ATCC 51142]